MAALGRALPLALLVRKPISVVKRSISTSTRLAGIHLFIYIFLKGFFFKCPDSQWSSNFLGIFFSNGFVG